MAIFTQIGGISTSSITNVLKGPLSKLFGSKMGTTNYRYPENLTNDTSRMHFVQFEIFNIMPVAFTEEGLTNIVKDKFTQATTNTTGLTKISNSAKRQTTSTISLYMPDTLNMTYDNNYDTVNLTLGAQLAEKAGQLKGLFEKNNSSAVDTIKSFVATDPWVQQLLVSQIAGKDNRDLLLKAEGYAYNPQIQMIYRGNNFRKFQFEFIMTAKSKEESDQITAICNAFIFASTPSVTPGAGMFYIPPSVFNVKLMMAEKSNLSGLSAMLQKAGNSLVPGLDIGSKIGSAMGGSKAKVNDRLFKTGDCVLENVNVDYAPGGWSAHSDGAPLQTRLTLNFSEIEILHRGRLSSGAVR